MPRRVVVTIIYLLGVSAIAAAVGWFGLANALDRLSERARSDLLLAADRLTGQLQGYRETAVLLADHPAITALIEETGDDLDAAQALLLKASDLTGSEELLLLDRNGDVIASSLGARGEAPNRADAPHFRRAMQGATGFHHAVTSAQTRAFLFAAPIFLPGGPVGGAVVVQIDAARVEARWRGEAQAVFFTDTRGIVFVTNRSELLFARRSPIDPRPNDAFNEADLTTPFVNFSRRRIGENDYWSIVGGGPYLPKRALHLTEDLPVIEMTGEILLDASPAVRLAALQAAVVAAFLLAFGVMLFAVGVRRRALSERLVIEARAKAQLESRVAARTHELSDAVERLREEVREREEAEAALKKAQQDLVQAGKLSALGQMSAGISHELNQPLMAIRSFAENGAQFIERGRPEVAAENLGRISELARRMGRIIKNLRAFARQEVETISDVDLVGVVDAVLEMTEARMHRSEVALHWQRPEGPVIVRGGEVRLQQVVMNLVANALDAIEGNERREIEIEVTEAGGRARLRLHDSGPGIADPQRIFDPFYSTKEVGAAEGMGLGLSISYGIVNSFGGTISGSNDEDGGAVFVVELARSEREAAA